MADLNELRKYEVKLKKAAKWHEKSGEVELEELAEFAEERLTKPFPAMWKLHFTTAKRTGEKIVIEGEYKGEPIEYVLTFKKGRKGLPLVDIRGSNSGGFYHGVSQELDRWVGNLRSYIKQITN